MEIEERSVCVAVLQYRERRRSGGYKLKSFHNKQDFREFLTVNGGRVIKDEAMVILLGGDNEITTVEAVESMSWILETA